MKLTRIICVAALNAMLMVFVCGCSIFKINIDTDNYIIYEYDGVSGYASLTAGIDTEALINDYIDRVGEDKRTELSEFAASLTAVADKCEKLGNGDEVSLSVSYDDTYVDYLNINVKQKGLKVTINGLIEGTLLDVFENINVKVSGIAPFAMAELVNNSDNSYVSGLTFSLDKTQYIKRGDMLKVTCIMNDEDAYELGYVVTDKEKSYSTENIDSYLFDASLMDEAVLSTLVDEAIDTVNSLTEDTQSRMLYKLTGSSNYLFQYNKEWVDSIELYDIQLLMADTDGSYDESVPVNKLYIVIYAYVTNTDYGNDGYFCFEYDNVILKADNSLAVNHDDVQLRFLCNEDYDKLMEEVYANNQITYTIEDISSLLQ